MGEACSMNGEKTIAYFMLLGNSEEKRSLGRRIRRWMNNIKMDLRYRIAWMD
jgi:hypothetical protein